ncbi:MULTISPECIES: HAD family hydrolase [unclassified Paenibacillus]|uniref:HAD family hydrolase n=1 Tax=unclassified Paenibacillus TaxID=185978 RepID=UPI001AE193FD|nr:MULTISPECIES: HAD family hydrolase [unclassified Paenibacillus]MBP1154627.1 putative hydrolase of the HAD superfamily [Paenibacillus sp. PvP091]MBP1169989.1 putative hydrolase of the HAD superfamily [Paenibacillus sp. PvR098]MBP2441017.1 putative hydrolase of the HAD superfamily [Paenibacillus sp. PvP052]
MNETVRLRGKRIIFFDVNQTLVQQNLSFEECFGRVWEHFTGRWAQEEKPMADQLWAQYIAKWQQRKKSRITFKQLDELQQQCLREAMEAMDVPVTAGMTRGFMQEIRRLQVEAKTMPPRTQEMLATLSRSYRLAIISNSPRSDVLLMLKRFDLDACFPPEHVFTALKPADKKPAPYLFKRALKAMQLSPKQAVMVGNSWKHDVCGAVKAGLDAVWLNPTDTEAGPDYKKITQQRLGKRKVFLIKQLDQLSDLFS